VSTNVFTREVSHELLHHVLGLDCYRLLAMGGREQLRRAALGLREARKLQLVVKPDQIGLHRLLGQRELVCDPGVSERTLLEVVALQ